MISSNIRYQNAILKLLNGDLDTNEPEEQAVKKELEDETLKGGDDATEALEKVFMEGGAKQAKKSKKSKKTKKSKKSKKSKKDNSPNLSSLTDSSSESILSNSEEEEFPDEISTYEEEFVDSFYSYSDDDDVEFSDTEPYSIDDDDDYFDIVDAIQKKTGEHKLLGGGERPLMGGGAHARRAIIVNDLTKYPYVLRHFRKE